MTTSSFALLSQRGVISVRVGGHIIQYVLMICAERAAFYHNGPPIGLAANGKIYDRWTGEQGNR